MKNVRRHLYPTPPLPHYGKVGNVPIRLSIFCLCWTKLACRNGKVNIQVNLRIAVNGTPSHSYGVSLAIWDHTSGLCPHYGKVGNVSIRLSIL